MNRLIGIFICLASVLLAQGCEGRQGSTKRNTGVLEQVDELDVEWDKLNSIVSSDPSIRTEVERLLGRYAGAEAATSDANGLQRIYDMIRDPRAEVSAAREALRLFVRMNAMEIVRESLLHRNRDVVIIASESLIVAGEKNFRDEEAIPYLIYVLCANNYVQEGSEEASAHRNMKLKLVEAIKQITHLDINMGQLDEEDPGQVEGVLAKARAWAKRKGIRLFEE